MPSGDISPQQEVLDIVISLNANCRAPLHDLLASNTQFSCIIYDSLMHCVVEVANDLKIPSIAFRSNSAIHAITYYACIQLEKDGHLPLKDSVSQDLVPGFHPLRFKDLPMFNYENIEAYLHLTAKVQNFKFLSAMICNTMEFMEQSTIQAYQQRVQVPFFTLGPLHKFAPASSSSLLEEDITCISWLDKQSPKSVLYVSLGSLASMNQNELTELAWGLANSEQPFLWVIRPGSIPGSEWIENLPCDFTETVKGRGFIVKWAPQEKVLAHSAVGGFWSHCGWNSTLESLCEGVPIICWPYFLDQRVHARYLSQVWSLGIHYESELERKEVEIVVRRLMVNEEGENMRERATEFKERAKQCIEAGGSSYNSLKKLVELIKTL
jgi:hypothetical protein